jgi:hypothetical protein
VVQVAVDAVPRLVHRLGPAAPAVHLGPSRGIGYFAGIDFAQVSSCSLNCSAKKPRKLVDQVRLPLKSEPRRIGHLYAAVFDQRVVGKSTHGLENIGINLASPQAKARHDMQAY